MIAPRRKITDHQRVIILRDNDNRCHICTREIGVGEAWDVEHPKALWAGGSDDLADLKPAHVDCHQGKTNEETGVRSKADRIAKKHVLGRKPSKAWGFRK